MKIARGWLIRLTFVARVSYTFRYIRDHVLYCNALCFTSNMDELIEVSWKQFQITESRLSHREHCKDDCLPLDKMASHSFQSFLGYTKLTHNTLERFRIKIIKRRLHATSLFWTLCSSNSRCRPSSCPLAVLAMFLAIFLPSSYSWNEWNVRHFFLFTTKTTQPRPQVFSVNGALTRTNAAFLTSFPR